MPALAAAPASPTVQTREPRAYGWQVGDRVTRLATIAAADGLRLDPDSLPRVGRHGSAFELQHVSAEPLQPRGGEQTWRLTLDYQVFVSPPAVRTFELPPVVLRFDGDGRTHEVRIDAWPLTVSPLVPVDVSPRTGLGEFQPDAPAPPADTSAIEGRLLACAAFATAVLLYLSHVYVGLPWLARRRRPFDRAWRALRGQRRRAGTPGGRRAAFKRLHEALNASAGAVLFEHALGDFIAAQPRFAPLQADLALFFQRSRDMFFAVDGLPSPAPEDTGAWLVGLCRRLRDAERGAA